MTEHMRTVAPPLLQVENLVFDYPGCRALDNVSFQLDSGSVTALVGPNGAGKTTLMRCIAGLDTPLRGQVRLAGIHVADAPRKAHRLAGYLSDSFGLYKSLTVSQCLTYAAMVQGISAREVGPAVDRVTAQMGLTAYVRVQCAKLSRGWRQRVGIAQTIIHRPRLLILDEPASGLDPEARHELALLLQKLRREGMTILVSSHILSELDAYSTHMLIIRNGKRIDFRPLHPDVQQTAPRRRIHIELANPAPSFAAWLQSQPHVTVEHADPLTATILFSDSLQAQSAFLATLIQNGFPVAGFAENRENLQQSYLTSVHAHTREQKEGT